jgi:Repeat of Unknown Function (DUF347)
VRIRDFSIREKHVEALHLQLVFQHLARVRYRAASGCYSAVLVSDRRRFRSNRLPRHLAASLRCSGTGRAAFRSIAACPGTERLPHERYPRSGVEQGSASHLPFWIIKIAATTLGETGGDALSMTMNLGYVVSSAIFFSFFIVTVASQVTARSFQPFLYWPSLSPLPRSARRWRITRIALSGSAMSEVR